MPVANGGSPTTPSNAVAGALNRATTTNVAGTPVVEMEGISKRFGSVRANEDVSLTLRAGEVHAVLGENGAGKTTLMNILSGMYHPDTGAIRIDGRTVTIASPPDALRQGIGTVYQHFTLVPNLSVLENVILGMDAGFVLDLRDAERRLREMLSDFGLTASPRTEVRHLSLGERQRVEIVKVLFRGSRVLLLDEPTSVLTPVEVEGLFRILRRLKADGVAVVLITHKLEEALDVSDRVTVLRQGRNVGVLEPDEIAGAARGAAKRRIVELMFGGTEPQAASVEPPAESSLLPTADRRLPILLAVQEVTVRDDRGATPVRGLTLELRAGEILGIAGVDGNGQKELGEAIAGQRHVSDGRITLGSRDITNKGVSVASRAGVGYVTDDRLGEGVVPGASVAENAVLKTVSRAPFSKRGFWLDRGAIENHAQRLVQEFDVRTPGTGTPMTLLSGGNIQKLLLARELSTNPNVLVCNKPTNGLDVKTAQFVLRTLRGVADAGRAVLLISSELDEIMEVSDRIGVMYNGKLVGVFPRAEANLETIGHLMLSGSAQSDAVATRAAAGAVT
jgi:simple sugar transport system ATP-binding protein